MDYDMKKRIYAHGQRDGDRGWAYLETAKKLEKAGIPLQTVVVRIEFTPHGAVFRQFVFDREGRRVMRGRGTRVRAKLLTRQGTVL